MESFSHLWIVFILYPFINWALTQCSLAQSQQVVASRAPAAALCVDAVISVSSERVSTGASEESWSFYNSRVMIILPFVQVFLQIVDAASAGEEYSFDRTFYKECLLEPALMHSKSRAQCDISNYKFSDTILSHGSARIVVLAASKVSGMNVAVKKIKNDVSGQIAALTEGCFLLATRHHAIPELECFYTDRDTIYLIMEHLNGRDLDYWLRNKLTITLDMVKKIAMDIGEVLQFLEIQGLIHRDVKPSNIILVPEVGAKLIDFEFATITTMSTTSAFTLIYTAPEVLQAFINDPTGCHSCAQFVASDRYSLGKTLLTLILNKPWPSQSQTTMEALIECSEGVSQEELASAPLGPFTELVQGLLRLNPAKRSDFSEYFRHLAAVELH